MSATNNTLGVSATLSKTMYQHDALQLVESNFLLSGMKVIHIYTGHSPSHAVGMAGCGHSKIARVLFVLYVLGAR